MIAQLTAIPEVETLVANTSRFAKAAEDLPRQVFPEGRQQLGTAGVLWGSPLKSGQVLILLCCQAKNIAISIAFT
jgi:hypothetical protein